MTHPIGQPGGGGGGTGNPTGPGRLEHNLGVRNADHYASLVDTFIASQLRAGFQPHQLDRNGRLLVATTTQES